MTKQHLQESEGPCSYPYVRTDPFDHSEFVAFFLAWAYQSPTSWCNFAPYSISETIREIGYIESLRILNTCLI
jgi:hypothetical protein